MIYLDNAATTPLLPEVLDAMMPYLKFSGNAGSIHSVGRNARNAIENARRQVAEFLDCDVEQIIFTSGGTESNNLAIKGVMEYLSKRNRKHIVTTAIEHESVLRPVAELCMKYGFDKSYVYPSKNGVCATSDVVDVLRENTGLVSIMTVNNETGAENPIRDIVKGLRAKLGNDVLIHTDCVQAAACCEWLSAREIGSDLISISGHKLHAPQGVGALFVKDRGVLSGSIIGGLSQEFGIRAGTENVAGIVGLGKACQLAKADTTKSYTYPRLLSEYFKVRLEHEFRTKGVFDRLRYNNHSTHKVISVGFDGVDGETLLLTLDGMGICVSAGAACSSHNSSPSHVLLAMGVNEEDARNSVRISFSQMNTDKECENAAESIANAVYVMTCYSMPYFDKNESEG